MKVGIAGGFSFGGLTAMALFGFTPGFVLLLIGLFIGSWELVQEKKEERGKKRFPSWVLALAQHQADIFL